MITFYANKVYFIVSDSDNKNIKDIYDSIVKIRCTELALSSEYITVSSKKDFQEAFSYIENEAKNEILPYIHIETHGYSGGLKLTSGAEINWQSLSSLFTKINIACKNNLFVTLASCWGGNFRDFIFDKINKGEKARSPVYGFIGPKRKITYNELENGYYDFFNTLFLEKDISKAYNHLIGNAADEEAYAFEVTNQLFKDLIEFYIENKVRPRFESKAYITYIIELLEKYHKDNGKYLPLQALEKLHKIATSEEFLVEALNKLRDEFFMIDLYNENDNRFAKLGGIKNWYKMVEHLK